MNAVAVILTTYNRPTLVRDAIRSVLEQGDVARLYIMDDGCNESSRYAINTACGNPAWRHNGAEIYTGHVVTDNDRTTWWRGPQRDIAARKAHIPYSWTINIALNFLLQNEEYIMFLCDDDVLYPWAIRALTEDMDACPDVHVGYGRLRSVQYGADGSRNAWANSGRPVSGMMFPFPTGRRETVGDGASFRTYFMPLDKYVNDPDTGRPYVEEGFWQPGPMEYGQPFCIDHNQAIIRRSCLEVLGKEVARLPYLEYWPEDRSYGVGDAGFFRRLAAYWPFYGFDVWTITKRYHAQSDGCSADEIRE